MAFGLGEDPRRSCGAVLEGVQYPASRAQLVEAAEDGEGTADVINLFKSLPDREWASAEAVWRDLGEASRRFGTGNFALEDEGVRRDRSDIGKETVERGPPGAVRHP
jgi:hypothetical protein